MKVSKIFPMIPLSFLSVFYVNIPVNVIVILAKEMLSKCDFMKDYKVENYQNIKLILIIFS